MAIRSWRSWRLGGSFFFYGGDGLVVVGYRYTDDAAGKGRTANKFFTKAPVPLH